MPEKEQFRVDWKSENIFKWQREISGVDFFKLSPAEKSRRILKVAREINFRILPKDINNAQSQVLGYLSLKYREHVQRPERLAYITKLGIKEGFEGVLHSGHRIRVVKIIDNHNNFEVKVQCVYIGELPKGIKRRHFMCIPSQILPLSNS